MEHKESCKGLARNFPSRGRPAGCHAAPQAQLPLTGRLDSLLPLLLSVHQLCGGFVQVMGSQAALLHTAVLTWYIRLGFCEGAWKLVWIK